METDNLGLALLFCAAAVAMAMMKTMIGRKIARAEHTNAQMKK